MMISQTYAHVGCKHEGEKVEVRPEVDGNAYYPKVPYCPETGGQLELIHEERES